MHLVTLPVSTPDPGLPVVLVRCDRFKLAKRLWRASAEDGTEFGVEVEKPLRHGETLFQTSVTRYVIEQDAEAVLEISLDLPSSAAAAVGWAIGNLHLELMSDPERLLTPDDKAARQLLDRIGISYTPRTDRFHPGRFARHARAAAPAHELGASHKH